MDVVVKLEYEDSANDATLLCRGCLVSYGEMKNMTEWGLAEDFYKTTNIQATNTEVITDLLCLHCEDMLVKCKRWTAQCQESDTFLRNTAKRKAQDNSSASQKNQDDVPNTVSCILFSNRLVVTVMAPDMTSKIPIPCPHCEQTFAKRPDLLHHLIKMHHVDSSFVITMQYYCSIATCPYNVNSGKRKFFSGRKFLNQHINKVHGESYSCTDCGLSFTTSSNYDKHLKSCNETYECKACSTKYKTNERLLVHLLRRHPSLHQEYKEQRKAGKRKLNTLTETKKFKPDPEKIDYMCDSPKRSFATQTLDNIKNDVTLTAWEKGDETKRDEISTQTVFEDLLSIKSSEEESMFFETVSLSDIQTQTFPLEFGLSRSNKETITSETQSPDLSLKGTQTCVCLYDSPRSNRFLDSVSSSPGNFTSTETQTGDFKDSMSDLLSFTSIETQTCFNELKNL